MEINQLRYLIMVAERESFSKAALHCFISQPAISEQIQKLEAEIGVPLFDRRRRIIVPTEAGKIFIKHAKHILEEFARVQKEIHDLNVNSTGNITLGVLPTIAPYLLPRVLELFASSYPQIEIKIQEDMTASLLRLVETGNADFGIVSSPITENGFVIEELFSEELLVALPSKHPLAKKCPLHMKDLRSERFIVLREGHHLGNQVLDFCHRHDFRPQILIRSGQLDTIQSIIGAGLGVSLVPRMAMLNAAGQVCYSRLKKPQPRRTIVVVWRSQTSLKKEAREFLNHLREVGKVFKAAALKDCPFNSKPKV